MKRSILFLALAAISAAGGAAAQFGKWQYSKDVDGFTDEVRHTAVVAVKEGRDTAGIVVRCANNEFDIIVAPKEFLGSNGPHQVKYRFDDGSPVDENWGASTDGKAVFAPEPVEFAKKLMQGSTLLFRVYDFREVPTDATFPLTGSSDAIMPVLKGCGIE